MRVSRRGAFNAASLRLASRARAATAQITQSGRPTPPATRCHGNHAAPAQRVWWTWTGGTPGTVPATATVYGTGFGNNDCTVQVAAAGNIKMASFRGDISKGIPIVTPCANTGQACNLTVWANNNASA
jgi:hypothetical protein